MSLLADAVRFRDLFVAGVHPCLDAAGRRTARAACRAWRGWCAAAADARAADAHHRAPTAAEMDELVARLRRLGLPWCPATEAYLRRHVAAEPCVPTDGGPYGLDALEAFLTRLYRRAVLPPKTNIGTLARGRPALRAFGPRGPVGPVGPFGPAPRATRRA